MCDFYADLCDKVIGTVGVIGLVALVCWNVWEFGRDYGRNEAIAAFECPKGSVFQIVRHDTGETKCVLPRRKA